MPPGSPAPIAAALASLTSGLPQTHTATLGDLSPELQVLVPASLTVTAPQSPEQVLVGWCNIAAKATSCRTDAWAPSGPQPSAL